MLKHLFVIIVNFDCVPKRLHKIVSEYVMFLMLTHKKHDLRTASRLFGTHESNFSRLLSHDRAKVISRSCLNRAIRRRLAKLGKMENSFNDIFIIIDATNTHRSGKGVENFHKFRSGGPYVEGHQFTNFILLCGNQIIPMCSVPFYSKLYCNKSGMDYQTEPEMVTRWIEMLAESDILPPWAMGKLHFLLDSGYDARIIQNAIRDIGAKFTVGLRSDRSVNGLSVKEYFLRNRRIPWRTIRIDCGNGVTKRKRKFRVRAVTKMHLKGFGSVKVICSEKMSRNARKTTRKYIATSDQSLNSRRITLNYAKRWSIETWHKQMKQKHGYGDCKSVKFRAIEAHINFCLLAFCLLGEHDPGLPRPGTTVDQYCGMANLQQAARVINLFGGREKLKILSSQALEKVVNS